MREAEVTLYDRKLLVPPLSRLPRAEVDDLAMRLGDLYYDRRGALVPLEVLKLIVGWLLLTGPLGTLRRQEFAVPLWRFACLCGIPLTGLSALVSWVLGREALRQLGPRAAEALAAVSKRAPAEEMAGLFGLLHQHMAGAAVLHGLWAAFLGLSALYLRRHLPPPGTAGRVTRS